VNCIRILMLNPEVAEGLVTAGVVPLLAVGLQGNFQIFLLVIIDSINRLYMLSCSYSW
jgi:hypothetical protein